MLSGVKFVRLQRRIPASRLYNGIFCSFIVQAASGLISTALVELQEELEAILNAEVDDDGI